MPLSNPPQPGETCTYNELVAATQGLPEAWMFDAIGDNDEPRFGSFWVACPSRNKVIGGPRLGTPSGGPETNWNLDDLVSPTSYVRFVARGPLSSWARMPEVGQEVTPLVMAWLGVKADGCQFEVSRRQYGALPTMFGTYEYRWVGPHPTGPYDDVGRGHDMLTWGNLGAFHPQELRQDARSYWPNLGGAFAYTGQNYYIRLVSMPSNSPPEAYAPTAADPGCPHCGRRGPAAMHYISVDGARRACPGWQVASHFRWVRHCSTCQVPSWIASFKGADCAACHKVKEEIHTKGVSPDFLTFGVEMETEGISYTKQAGQVARKFIKNRDLDWEAKDDGSLRGEAAEVCTPPLRFNADGLDELRQGAKALRNAGARTSPRCGGHIHVGVKALSIKQVGSVAEWWLAAQECVLAALPIIRSRQQFCEPFHSSHLQSVRSIVNGGQARESLGRVTGKYCSMNMSHLGHSGYGTLEFRFFNGTLHVGKLAANAALVCHLVSKASRDIRGSSNPVTHYSNTRAGMVKLLDDLEITDKSARYHLLGKWATEADLPVPEGVTPKTRKKRAAIVARTGFLIVGRYNVIMTGREYTRLGLGCGMRILGRASTNLAQDMRANLDYADRNWYSHDCNGGSLFGSRITREIARNDSSCVVISLPNWQDMVTSGRVAPPQEVPSANARQ